MMTIIQWILVGIIVLVILGILIPDILMIILAPFMWLYNILTDRKQTDSEQDFVTGILTLGIKNGSSFGEVMIDGTGFGRTNKPAKIYHGKPDDSIKQGEQVLIIEVKNGVAYVVKNKQ
ncbi:MAG: hypothetical protein LKF42_05875 [Streptococcaceae bacterium]|jgi:predicted MFS family arabinose efflux permease|nr:hypothetical protein [Streptococcaceae bacterium]MCH4177393.1 hypothetical protein [Streptococcaceae bacterium]